MIPQLRPPATSWTIRSFLMIVCPLAPALSSVASISAQTPTPQSTTRNAPKPKGQAAATSATNDLALLQHTWKITSLNTSDGEIPFTELARPDAGSTEPLIVLTRVNLNVWGLKKPAETSVVTGNTWSCVPLPNQKPIPKFTFELHPDQYPKAIDFLSIDHQQDLKAIYRLDGDTLTICLSANPRRPRYFPPVPDPDSVSITFQRPKSKNPQKPPEPPLPPVPADLAALDDNQLEALSKAHRAYIKHQSIICLNAYGIALKPRILGVLRPFLDLEQNEAEALMASTGTVQRIKSSHAYESLQRIFREQTTRLEKMVKDQSRRQDAGRPPN